jgi:transposase
VLNLSLPVDTYLCVVPADMRRSFDGLVRMATDHIARDPLRGGLYVFINRRRDRAKLLYWDGDGLAIWYKRLEEGTFSLPMVEDDVTGVTLSGTDLTLLLQGLDLKIARRRKRYRRPA